MHQALVFFFIAISLLQPAVARADAAKGAATIESPAPASSETEQIVDWAREILEQVITLPADKRAQFDSLVKDAQGFALFPKVSKRGFIVAEISGRGVLIYREKDGNWSLPILLGIRGTSIGPQLGATSSDVLVVFKTEAALRRLGEQTHQGIDVPTGSPAAESEIISYHTRRGLVLGQSVDKTSLYLDAVGNEFLDGQGVKPGAIGQSVRAGLRPPPCVQKFVEQTNTLQGKPASTMQWR